MTHIPQRVGVTELARHLMRECDIVSERFARGLVQALIRAIAEHMVAGDLVCIPGFGAWKLKRIGAREWRSAKLQRSFRVKPGLFPGWRPSPELAAKVRDNLELLRRLDDRRWGTAGRRLAADAPQAPARNANGRRPQSRGRRRRPEMRGAA